MSRIVSEAILAGFYTETCGCGWNPGKWKHGLQPAVQIRVVSFDPHPNQKVKLNRRAMGRFDLELLQQAARARAFFVFRGWGTRFGVSRETTASICLRIHFLFVYLLGLE